jgi:hypothetical protein
MFCLTAVLRSDRKDFLSFFQIRSLTPQQAVGNALAVAVQSCHEPARYVAKISMVMLSSRFAYAMSASEQFFC